MAIRVSLPPSNVVIPLRLSSLGRQSHPAASISGEKFTKTLLKLQLPAGSYQYQLISRRPSFSLSVICHSTNGKPLNGNMNGSSESLPDYESFDVAGIQPLGEGWDPWKLSGEYSGSSGGEGDTSVRNPGGETSGRGGMDVVPRNTVNKYGAVGNEGEEPFRILADGRKAYLDELDVLTLLVPPPFLKPMSNKNYNHAAFLWKKIAAIPEERRHRLLDLLEPRHITAMWKMTELRYEDPGLYLQNASRFLLNPAAEPLQPLVWTGQVNEVPWVFNFLSRFKKAFFYSQDRELYGRVITGGGVLEGLGNKVAPLYFKVRPIRTVLATNEQCDFAFSYDDGHFELKNAVPNGFPQPGKHPFAFGKKFYDYVRVVGPGVVVGQSWYGSASGSEVSRNSELGPRKYLGEFLLIQNYAKVSS
ncbi:uncharacterized protein [Physcomitrium patens]|uniref:Uncharacterized protein n=1 Tax=Physcomitrium patens TaxID=3218 RepID=A0A2K1JLH4_PHYPA|nr:uncharacterized protein LOC112290528 [Physcomitrium patens]PNR42369.1 hypothetical protein PHYPA_017198 [Physcomitrium patens]|eukprot:XP_024392645.1 uncharacterized protein LOC112290528 [Physcomitrella patens]